MTLPIIPDYQFDKHFNELINSNLSIGNLTAVGALPYTDIFGSIFWGIIFAIIFVLLWIVQEDVTIPALLGMIIGGSMWTLMPAEWVGFAMTLTVISLAGLVYSIVKRG